jgi:hypothetical protein
MTQAPMAGYRPGECFVGAARKASRRLTQFYDDALVSRAGSDRRNIRFWPTTRPRRKAGRGRAVR